MYNSVKSRKPAAWPDGDSPRGPLLSEIGDHKVEEFDELPVLAVPEVTLNPYSRVYVSWDRPGFFTHLEISGT